ncbi:hypothetical protein C8J56DRAFT_1050236 [Mycena floridula]|nr:hypothetical protein C8J56DRAFT_1050236 [Mycena floridula]
MSFTTPVDDIGTTNQAYESEPDNPLNVRRKTATAAHYNSPAETLSELQTSDSDLTHSPNFRNHPVKIVSDFDDEATTRRRQRSRSRGGYHDRTPEMMPLPPNKGAPKKFRGDYAYVRKFLKQYVQLCRAYNVTSEQEKCEKLLDYVSSRVGKFIESNSNYINKDWDELEKDLLHYYDAERVDTRYALKDLVLLTDKWAKKDMSDLATYKRYSIEFHTIAGWLVMKDMLTIRHRDGHFFRGIKRGLREKLEERYINQNRGATLKDPIPIAAIDKMIENQFNRHSYRDELEDTLTSRKHQSKSQRDRDYDYDSDSDDSGSEQAPGDESDTEDSDEEDSNDGRQNKRHIREGKKKSTKRKHSKSRRDEDNNSDREDPNEEDDSKHNKSSRHSRKNHKTYDSARDEDDRKVERLVKECLAEGDQKATRGRTRSDSVPDTASSKSKSNKRVPDAAELDALIDKMRTMEVTDPRYQGLYMQAYLINPVIAKIVKQPPNPNEVPQQARRNMFNGVGPRQYQTMQVAQQTPAVQSVQTGPPLTGPNLIPVAGNGYQGAPATMQSFQEEGCFGCGLGGHMLRNCQRVNDLIMEGLVTRDDLGRLRYLNGNLVRRINGLYLADSVVRTINSQAPALSTFLAEIDEASNRTLQVNWAGESYPAQVYAKTDKQAGTGREAREKVNDRSRAPPNSTSAIGKEIRAENRPIQGHVHQPQPVKVVPKPVSPDNAMTQRPAYRSENPVPVPREGLQTRGLKPAFVPMDKTAGQLPQRAEPRPPADPVPEPIPFDAQKTRFVPTDDVVMKEVNNGHVSSNEARKRNPRQSELQRRVDVKALMRKILKTPIAVTMEEYLGTSREMAEEVTKLLRFKNAKSLTDDEAVLLTALQAEMYYPEQEDYYGDNESDDSDYPDISNPTSNIAMSREMSLPEGRDRAPLITIMFECQGKPINAILDSGSMLNIVCEDVFAASIRYPKKAEERITMRDANGNDGELVGLSRSVRLDIGTISTRANLHIGPTTLPYPMLLGRPYMLDNKVSIDERDEGTFVIFEPDGQDRWELFTNPAELMRVHTVDTQNGPVTYRNIYHQEAAEYARSTGYGGCYAVLDAIVPGSPKMLQDDFIHTMKSEAPETRKVQTPDDSERQELSDESTDSQSSDSDLDSDTESESESDGESESETDEENDVHSLANQDENTVHCSTPNPNLEVYDNSEPPLHDKIAQWMREKSWVTNCWEDLVETAMARTQITAEAPPLLENGYADTTKIEPPLIIWDERHYFGIYQNAEIYLIPKGRYGLAIAEEFREEMMDKAIKFLTEVNIMIDSQSVKMDFISQQVKGGFKRMQGHPSHVYDGCTAYLVGKLWKDKLDEIMRLEVEMADQRLEYTFRMDKFRERNTTIMPQEESLAVHVLSAQVVDTVKGNDLTNSTPQDNGDCMELGSATPSTVLTADWALLQDDDVLGVPSDLDLGEEQTTKPVADRDTIWAEPGVLKANWRTFIDARWQNIEDLTDNTNNRAWVIGSDIAEAMTGLPLPLFAATQEDVADRLHTISVNGSGICNSLQDDLEKFYDNTGRDTRKIRKLVSNLIKEMKRGLRRIEFDKETTQFGAIRVVDSGHPEKSEKGYRQAEFPKGKAAEGCPKDDRRILSDGTSHREQSRPLLSEVETKMNEGAAEINTSESTLDQERYRLTYIDSQAPVATSKASDYNQDLDPESFLKGSQDLAQLSSLLAPRASRYFIRWLENLERHKTQLSLLDAQLKVWKNEVKFVYLKRQLDKPYQRMLSEWISESVLGSYPDYTETGKVQTATELTKYGGRVHQSFDNKANVYTLTIVDPSDTQSSNKELKQDLIQLNSTAKGTEGRHQISTEDLAPCVLCPRNFKQRGLKLLTADEQAQVGSNIETRRLFLNPTTVTASEASKLNEDKYQSAQQVCQTTTDPMSGKPRGCADSVRPPSSTTKPNLDHDLDKPKVDNFFLSAFWLPSGEQQPEGFWLSPVHRVARSVTRSPFTREGALYEPAFRTIRTGDLARGELVMHSLVASSPVGLAQHEVPAKPTLVFGATLLDRSYTMGIAAEGVFGFVLLFGVPIDGIRESINNDSPDNKLINPGRLISPKHSLYPVLQDCLLEQINDADADIFTGSSEVFEFVRPVDVRDTRSAVAPSLAPNSRQVSSIPKVQLVADVVRLHHLTRGFEKRQRRILRKDTVLMIQNYQENAIGHVVMKPGPNHMPVLISELVRLTMMVSEVSQRETHSRKAMRANPFALRYLTQHLSGEERAAFICLASVFIHLHGVDAMQDPKERIRVTKPVAHFDTLICLTMEAVPDDEVRAPNFLEREFQWACEILYRLAPTLQPDWAGLGYRPKDERVLQGAPPGSFLLVDPPNRRQVFSLHVPDASQIVYRAKPTSTPSSPGMYYAEDVLALLPAGTVIVDRLPSSRKRAAETIEEEWYSMGKIVQYNLSAQATPTVLTPRFQAKVTRYSPYNVDATLADEPPADDEEVMFEPPFHQQTISLSMGAPNIPSAAAEALDESTIAGGESDRLSEVEIATNPTAHRRRASHQFSRTYTGEMGQRSKTKEFGETAGNTDISGITLGNQGTLLQQRIRSNSSPEPPTTSLSTQRPCPPAARWHRNDYDPPTTPYLRPREYGELEEGEIDELEYMNESELEDLDPGSTVAHDAAEDLGRERGAGTAYRQPPVHSEKHYATIEVSPMAPKSTKAKPEPVPAQVSTPAAHVEYPSIWQTMPPDPFPPLHEHSSAILVNTVIAEDPADILRPPKPPLPPLKRRASQLDGPDNWASSSSSDNMVLGASVATMTGSAISGVRMAPGRFTPTAQFTGVLDFHQQERQAGRHLSSNSSRVQKEPSTPDSSLHLLTVSPGRANETANFETYRRPAETWRVVEEDGDDGGDEMSSEEDNRDETRTDSAGSNDADFIREFFIDDFQSWKADFGIAADLVSRSSLSPRSTAGVVGSSLPSSNATDDDMDPDNNYLTPVDECPSSGSDDLAITQGRDRPRSPFNLADPEQQYVVEGERVYSEMYYFHHMSQGRAEFPDNRLTPAVQEASEYIHHPSAVRDPLGYHDHGLSATKNIMMPSPEAIIEQANPDLLPGPGHPLSGNGLVRKVIVSKKSSLLRYPPPLDDYRLRIGRSVELEKGEIQRGAEDLADDYHMLDGSTRELQKMQERDAAEYYDMLDSNRLEETVFVDKLPLVDEPSSFRIPAPARHDLVEYQVPVNTDIAGMVHDLKEQVEVYIEREAHPRQMFRNIATSPTLIQESPHVYTMDICRQIRSDIHRTVGLASHIVSLPLFRNVLNRIPEEVALKHYFRNHCPFFRLLEKDVLMELQGFNIECLHQQPPTTRYKVQHERHKPRNPLLLPEEDEFFFYAAQLLDHFHLFNIANALREVRGKHLMRPKDIRITTSESLELRIRQLERQPESLAQAANTLKKARMRAKEQFNKQYAPRLIKESYEEGDLGLVRNIHYGSTFIQLKTEPRYLGPYEVIRRTYSRSYKLKELDGTRIRGNFAVFRVIRYISRHSPDMEMLADEGKELVDDSKEPEIGAPDEGSSASEPDLDNQGWTSESS